VSAFIALSIRDFLPSWLTVTVIARDVMILLGVFLLFLNQLEFDIKPSIVSKITTCVQFVVVITVLSEEYFLFLGSYNPYLSMLLHYLPSAPVYIICIIGLS
jgi:cardiolipin synthase